jgi:DNA-binding beta-propeller fold protein YncE
VASSITPAQPRRRLHARPHPVALVAAESEDHLVALELPSGRVLRRVSLPSGPQYVAAENGATVATSPPAGAVTVIEGDHREVLHGFGAPHLVAIAPDGKHAYVTDDDRGTLDVIRLFRTRVTSTTRVGLGAHHMASSPNERRLWIALGESARSIVIVDTTDIDHPRVVGSFDPGFAAHDLSFSPNGRQVWVTSAVGPEVSVFDAVTHRLLFRVPVGPPPQHVAFGGGFALLTSGYGSTIEKVNPATGRVVAHAHAPYGSFELDAAHGYVVTSSLLNGEVAVFTPGLKLLHVRKVAAATRDLTITMQ